MSLIVTNPNLSGRALKAMFLIRDEKGDFAVHEDHPDIMIGDGQTTIVHIPLGARLVISEATEPALAPVMAAHPVVTGRPASAMNTPEAAVVPLTPREEARRATLASRTNRSHAEDAELAALQARVAEKG
jgi:hypothetical protein